MDLGDFRSPGLDPPPEHAPPAGTCPGCGADLGDGDGLCAACLEEGDAALDADDRPRSRARYGQ